MYVGEPIDLFNFAKLMYKTSSAYKEIPKLVQHTEEEFAKKCIQLIDYSNAVNQLDTSNEISQYCLIHFQESKYLEAIKAEMTHGNGELILEKLKD